MFDTRCPCKVKAMQTTPARADCFFQFQPFKLARVESSAPTSQRDRVDDRA